MERSQILKQAVVEVFKTDENVQEYLVQLLDNIYRGSVTENLKELLQELLKAYIAVDAKSRLEDSSILKELLEEILKDYSEERIKFAVRSHYRNAASQRFDSPEKAMEAVNSQISTNVAKMMSDNYDRAKSIILSKYTPELLYLPAKVLQEQYKSEIYQEVLKVMNKEDFLKDLIKTEEVASDEQDQ